MTDYYVDLDSPGAWNGRGGLNSTTDAWLGLSGLQQAADVVTAGNTIKIKGTVVCTTLKNITYDNLSGTFTVGEEVQVDASNKGIVSEDTGTILTVEVTAGAFADNNTMTGQTSGATADVNVTVAVKSTALNLDTNAGTAADGYVKFIGVNSSWVNDETRCKLDGNAGLVAGCTGIITRTIDLLYFENIEVDDSDDVGIDRSTTVNYNLLINCWAHDCDGIGFKSYNDETYIRCLATNNGNAGFRFSANSKGIFCIAHNNLHGFHLFSDSCNILGCITGENTSSGLYGYASSTGSFFNVIDENTDGISFISGVGGIVLCNRITNQSDDGIVVSAGETCYEDWNLFYGNTGDDRDDTAGAGLIEQGGNSKTNSTGDGYTDQTNHDFNLTDSADYRREAITLPKWDGTSP